MKKFFRWIVFVIVAVPLLFLLGTGAMGIKPPCDPSAPDFWKHISPEGSDHLSEFIGGASGVNAILEGALNGSISYEIWSTGARTLVVLYTTGNPTLLIFGSQIKSTMFIPRDGWTYIKAQTEGGDPNLTRRTSNEDDQNFKRTARCFIEAAPIPESIPVRTPVNAENVAIGAFALAAVFTVLGFGKRLVFGGSPA